MKALVIGATGGFGGAVAKEMLARELEVTALVRPGGRQPDLPGAREVAGDALDRDAVARAARGMDVIVHAFNVPYPEWDSKVLDAATIVADVAAEEGATILFPGNVYGLGPDFSAPLSEDARREAPTALGELRNRIEDKLRETTERGARVIVLRAGDYFGPGAANGWLEILIKGAVKGGAILDPAPPGVPHAWAYLPDVARAGVDLLERGAELDPFESFHFEGNVLTSAELITALRNGLGDSERKVRRLPWWAMRLGSPFWPTARHVLKMRYLWNEPVRLDGARLRRVLGDVPETPLDEAVRSTLAGRAP